MLCPLHATIGRRDRPSSSPAIHPANAAVIGRRFPVGRRGTSLRARGLCWNYGYRNQPHEVRESQVIPPAGREPQFQFNEAPLGAPHRHQVGPPRQSGRQAKAPHRREASPQSGSLPLSLASTLHLVVRTEIRVRCSAVCFIP